MKLKVIVALVLLAFPALASATTYYLATAADGGSDSNNGLSAGAPWLSPNHTVNCGDVITAKASTSYDAANFGSAMWGTVTCVAGNNVAWLKCETFDACKISVSNINGMAFGKSYWGVQGWEIHTTGSNASCFVAMPQYGSTIHHLIWANNVANGCISSGFTTSNNGTTQSVDYLAVVGNIAWNAAATTAYCDSGITVYEPMLSDSAPGTHIYIAGNFSFDNVNGNPCAGHAPSDGNGIILDSIDFGQGGGTPYCGQIVVENNITVFNGGRGIIVGGSGNSCAPIYLLNNTAYGNSADPNEFMSQDCGELASAWHQYNVQGLYNIAQATAPTACTGHNSYAITVDGTDSTNVWDYNLGTGVNGQNSAIFNNLGFSWGSHNVWGTNPQFVNPVDPGQPNCSGKASVPDCMATVSANYRAQASQAKGLGYQPASTDQTDDPYFPQWLCNVNLPAGLITTPCANTASRPAPPTGLSVTVK